MNQVLRWILAAVVMGSAAASARAQCVRGWDTVVGSPGVTSDGYAGPMGLYNDGRGPALYIGGSFNAMGGYVARSIARWDPPTQSWEPLGEGCFTTNTNYFAAAIGTFDFGAGPELVVGGSFATAGGTPSSANLGRWNGSRWASIPTGQPNGAVWALEVFQNELYAGGGFASLGAVTASGIARYGEAGWANVGTGMSGGFSPSVFALKVHTDASGTKLYAGGRFASIGGVAGMIGRWTGTAWQPVGGGISAGSTFADVECMAVFNGQLYVGGWDLRPFQSTANCNVARWDGSRWTTVGQYLGGRTTSLAVFDDGTGPALYAGGTAQPSINYVAKLVGNTWVTLDGGVGQPATGSFPSVFGLMPFAGKLYVAGDFDYVGTGQASASGIAARNACTASCDPDFNQDGNADQGDVAYLVNVIAGGPNPSGRDPDFNADGNVDQADLAALVNLIAGGACP